MGFKTKIKRYYFIHSTLKAFIVMFIGSGVTLPVITNNIRFIGEKRKIVISDQCILTTYLDYELPTIKLSPKLRQNRFKVQSNETQNSQCKFAMCGSFYSLSEFLPHVYIDEQ